MVLCTLYRYRQNTMNINIPETLALVDEPGCKTTFRVTEELVALAYAYLHARNSVVFESYEKLFLALRVLEKVIGKPAQDIACGRVCGDIHKHYNWIPLIEATYPGLLNFIHRITASSHVDQFFENNIPGLSVETELNIKDVLGFYPIDRFHKDVRAQVLVARYADPEAVLVDPYTVSTVYTGCSQDVISCVDFTRFELPKIGQEQLCTLEVFRARFTDFTHGLFDCPDFPWENTWIAGGALKLLYCEPAQLPVSDVDIFITADNNDLLVAKMRTLLLWLETKTVQFGAMRISTFGAVCNVSFAGLPRVIQIIANVKRNLYGVMQNFDADYCRWACYGRPLVVRASACAIKALRTRTAMFVRESTKREERASKALRYGYNLHPSVLVDCCVHIEDLLQNRVALCAAVDAPSYSSNSEEQTALWSAKSTQLKMSTSADEAVEGLDLRNINQGYTKQTFINFDMNSLPDEVVVHRRYNVTVKSRTGFAIRLNVEHCVVDSFVVDTLAIVPPEGWTEFAHEVASHLGAISTPTDFDVIGANYFSTQGDRLRRNHIVRGCEIRISFTLQLTSHRSLVFAAKSVMLIAKASRVAQDEITPPEHESDGSFD